MLTYILLGLLALVGLFLIVVAMQPSEFRTTRSATMAAPASAVFPYVNDLRKFQEWSPWARMDPTCKTTFEGPAAGEGAKFHWAGDNQVGEGGMTIVESRPHELVRIRLEFLKPFQATNTAEFLFQPEGDRTRVTWSMFGKNNFFFKAFGLFVNCDKMIGSQFEEGLANMKAIVETRPATAAV